MKIALPTRNKVIDDHFGHCEFFTVMTLDDQKNITHEETLASPEGCGCKSNIAQTLSEMGVSLMLAGNMGTGAVNKLKFAGIEVVRGCKGSVDQVAKDWIGGQVLDSGEGCKEHDCH